VKTGHAAPCPGEGGRDGLLRGPRDQETTWHTCCVNLVAQPVRLLPLPRLQVPAMAAAHHCTLRVPEHIVQLCIWVRNAPRSVGAQTHAAALNLHTIPAMPGNARPQLPAAISSGMCPTCIIRDNSMMPKTTSTRDGHHASTQHRSTYSSQPSRTTCTTHTAHTSQAPRCTCPAAVQLTWACCKAGRAPARG
jgi:hypothetical protein